MRHFPSVLNTRLPRTFLLLKPPAFMQRNTQREEGESEGPHTKYIEPGIKVPRLTARNKMILGLKDAVSPLSRVGWLTSSAYELTVPTMAKVAAATCNG